VSQAKRHPPNKGKKTLGGKGDGVTNIRENRRSQVGGAIWGDPEAVKKIGKRGSERGPGKHAALYAEKTKMAGMGGEKGRWEDTKGSLDWGGVGWSGFVESC